MRWWGRRPLAIGIGIGATLLAAVLLLLFVVTPSPDTGRDGGAASPEDAVRAYLEGLAAGDVGAARAMLTQPTPARLLSADVLRRQRNVAALTDIAVPTVSSTTDDGPERKVRATYRFAERRVDTVFRALRSGDRWRVADGLVEVRLDPVAVPQPTFFGVAVGNARTVYVFPGPQGWGSADKYFTAQATGADPFPVAPPGPVRVALAAALSADGSAAVEAAVRSYLDDCAKSSQAEAGADRKGCGQTLYRSAVAGTVGWTAPSDLSGLVRTVRTTGDVHKVDVAGAIDWSARFTPTYDDGVPKVTTVDEYLYGTVDLGADPPAFTPG